MFYYNYKDHLLVSKNQYTALQEIPQEKASKAEGTVYVLNKLNPLKSRRSFCISDYSLCFIESEGISLLQKQNPQNDLPQWLMDKIQSRQAVSLNTEYPSWKDVMETAHPEKWRINIAGLGDVGGTLLVGLTLLGGDVISHIGLYDTDSNKVKRWVLEAGQICAPFWNIDFPEVSGIGQDDMFDCDMFVFCVTRGVPPVGSEIKDVRMAQYKSNSSILKAYARCARKKGFKGYFSVVSDPVDLLCRDAFIESSTGSEGDLDFCGISPEMIRGFGLGVMNGRASFYAKQDAGKLHYINEGKAFGPHGEGLVIADSIDNYNPSISDYLTKKAMEANREVRSLGFKPFVAPAISSGAIPIISVMRGDWHYSSVFLGGVFFGCKNRENKSGTEIESANIPQDLWNRLKKTYEGLEKL